MSNLLTLAERCENVAEPSRQLDATIYCASKPHPMGFDLRPEDDGTISVHVDGFWHPGYTAAPKYTSSIDAAATLVPNGLEWHATNHRTRRLPNNIPEVFDGWAGVYGEPMVGSECDSYAATPALALCSAALNARHYRDAVGTQSKPQEGGKS